MPSGPWSISLQRFQVLAELGFFLLGQSQPEELVVVIKNISQGGKARVAKPGWQSHHHGRSSLSGGSKARRVGRCGTCVSVTGQPGKSRRQSRSAPGGWA